MSLTLPFIVGKKYVRRDGEKVEAERPVDGKTGWTWFSDGRNRDNKGNWFAGFQGESSWDIVADHIEPAQGHPHSAHITKFAWDARETPTPWDRWEASNNEGRSWHPMDRADGFNPDWMYRQKPIITPDPHAESMKLYAEDAAQTDRAWDRWECQSSASLGWHALDCHPKWLDQVEYRRRPAP